MRRQGIVYLVGAGPGDPGLLTVKGLEVLRKAETVVYDRLVHPDLLLHAPPHAEKIYVGKAPGRHTRPQAEINEILVRHGLAGRIVARLKGGDPFIFGRGAEEAESLRRAGVTFEIVPGVSSAVAAPAYAGIPVTYRGLARHFAVITGHCHPSGEEIDWSVWTNVDTLVILMGLGHLQKIAGSLVEHGRDPDTPVAVIRSATTAAQDVVAGTLANIAKKAVHLSPPAVVVVGDVVRLGQDLAWFDPAHDARWHASGAWPVEDNAAVHAVRRLVEHALPRAPAAIGTS